MGSLHTRIKKRIDCIDRITVLGKQIELMLRFVRQTYREKSAFISSKNDLRVGREFVDGVIEHARRSKEAEEPTALGPWSKGGKRSWYTVHSIHKASMFYGSQRQARRLTAATELGGNLDGLHNRRLVRLS